MAQPTLRAQVATLTALVETLVSAQAPAQGAPKQARAMSPEQGTFLTFVHERAASKVPCTVHARKACTRTFQPTSAGLANHVARIV